MVATTTSRAPRASAPRRELRGELWSTFGLPIALIVGVLAVWTLIAWAFNGSYVIPFPWTLAAQLVSDWGLLWLNAASTLSTAGWGLLWAVVIVVPLAVLCFVLPFSQPTVVIIATVVHVIPMAALAPIVVVAASPGVARIIIAAIFVYFPLLIGVLLGLRSTDERAMDVVTASGGGVWAQVRFLRLQSALPSIVAGLQIGVPAAILGALVSEFFGADRGLGQLLLASQQYMLVDRVWAIGVFAGILAAIGFGLVALLARLLVPWAGKGGTVSAQVAGAQSQRLSTLKTVLSAIVAIAIVTGFWYSLRYVFGLDAYFVKLPHELVDFMLNGDPNLGGIGMLQRPGPSGFWESFSVALGQTLLDAIVGFVAGTVLAILGAIALVAMPNLSRVLMPMAIVLRSIPLLAMLPIIVIVFGRGLLGVTVIIVLVTFFPTLVNVMAGLRAAPEGAVEVIRASGGSSFAVARRVRLLYAVPSIIASAQIAIPAAIGGATLAEWLATGNGVGYMLTISSVQAKYLQLWTASILLTLLVLVIYGLLGVISGAISRRIGVAP